MGCWLCRAKADKTIFPPAHEFIVPVITRRRVFFCGGIVLCRAKLDKTNFPPRTDILCFFFPRTDIFFFFSPVHEFLHFFSPRTRIQFLHFFSPRWFRVFNSSIRVEEFEFEVDSLNQIYQSVKPDHITNLSVVPGRKIWWSWIIGIANFLMLQSIFL